MVLAVVLATLTTYTCDGAAVVGSNTTTPLTPFGAYATTLRLDLYQGYFFSRTRFSRLRNYLPREITRPIPRSK